MQQKKREPHGSRSLIILNYALFLEVATTPAAPTTTAATAHMYIMLSPVDGDVVPSDLR